MDLVAYLKEAGPYTAPLCVVGAVVVPVVVKYLQGRITKLEDELKDARADATQLREKRTEDLVKQSREFGEIREAMNTVMRDFNVQAQALLARVTS